MFEINMKLIKLVFGAQLLQLRLHRLELHQDCHVALGLDLALHKEGDGRDFASNQSLHILLLDGNRELGLVCFAGADLALLKVNGEILVGRLEGELVAVKGS